MAHLIEEYAKHCGVKIGEPILDGHFYPIKHEKYITIDTSNSSPACQYPYWSEVVALLHRSMPRDYSIVRIGHPSDQRFYGEDTSLFELQVKQLIHVIKGSSFHIAIGGSSSHIAAAFGIPQVCVQSNTLNEYAGPVWNIDKAVLINSDLPSGKPSFAAQEEEPVIFSVWPDKIINGAHKVFPKVRRSVEDVKYIGKLYHHHLFELVPDFTDSLQVLQGKLLNIRMDLEHNVRNLERWLQTNQSSIITREKISLDLLRKYKRSVAFINIFNESGGFPDEEYLHDLKAIGIQFRLFTREKDSPEFRKELNRYFDFAFERVDVPDDWPLEMSDKTKFHTNKVIFCKNGQFGSRSHMEAKRSDNVVIKSLDFLEELEHFYLYEESR